MAYKPLVKIAGVAIPPPSTYEANSADIVDSARNVSGYVVGSVIRSDVAKVSLSWNFLTVKEWADILSLFRPSAGGKFYNSVSFLNQSSGTWETRTMYVGDRSAGLFILDDDGNLRGYTNCKLALVEV